MKLQYSTQGPIELPSGMEEAKQFGISNSTERNWTKLNSDVSGKLTTRANKRKSQKRIFPVEYLSNPKNSAFLKQVFQRIEGTEASIYSIIYTLAIVLLKKNGILEKQNVVKVLAEYSETKVVEGLLSVSLPEDEFDLLGLVYQCFLHEGEKNIAGSYYTPQKIVRNLTEHFDFSHGETLLDPCCGSGAFLLAAEAETPNQLFGVDNDYIAVFIAKINLLIKFKNADFLPQVYCTDFLNDEQPEKCPIFNAKYDYIATNPPWGAMDNSCSPFSSITKESFGLFFLKSYGLLKEGGIIRFLFPEAILNVKAHKEIREFIVHTAGLARITTYDNTFSGVSTKYVDIECGGRARNGSFVVRTGGSDRIVSTNTVYETENLAFNLLSDDETSIVRTVKKHGRYTLQNSTWALGIVTGDNKAKLFAERRPGMEKIYTGKEISPYQLLPAKNYILYDRMALQQVARDEIYRAPEKLVYKFVSKKLVFAYDNTASLFLNSANILIPNIPNMSVKTVMAFLNSKLFQFMYIKLFGEVKILKGNLMELPFPEISEAENVQLSSLVDQILHGDKTKNTAVDDFIFSLYRLSNDKIRYIGRAVNG